jgi:lipopolysaccharide transport system permease protein
MQAVSQILERRELLVNLMARNLKIRYKGSFFGFFWTLLHPVFLIAVYMAFIGLMRFPMDLSYLICGVIPWHFLTMCVGDSINVIEGNSSLIKKTSFPRLILPLSTLSANTINLVLSLVVVAALLPAIKLVSTTTETYSFNLVYLAPAVLLQIILVAGLCLFVSVSNVYFKDTEHITGVVLMAWFFLSPVIYRLEDITKLTPASPLKQLLLKAFFLNPMVLVLSLYRKAFLNTQVPCNLWVGLSLALTAAVFAAGWLAFRAKERYFADEM